MGNQMVALAQVFPSQKPDSSNAPLEGCNLASAHFHFPFSIPQHRPTFTLLAAPSHLSLLYRVARDMFNQRITAFTTWVSLLLLFAWASVIVAKPNGVPRGFYKHSQAAVSNAEVDGWSNAARLARGLAPRKPATLYSPTRVHGGLTDFYLPGMGL